MSTAIAMGNDNTSEVTSRRQPGCETSLLLEEIPGYSPGSRFTRVLSSFEFLANGEPAAIDLGELQKSGFAGVGVVGLVGTILGKEGLFAQCAWFGDDDLDWFWVRLPVISTLQVRRDPRFRGGMPCVWLGTPHGDYALCLPHKEHVDLWEKSLTTMGPQGPAAKCMIWPTSGTRPAWWGDEWADLWPFEKTQAGKRRASTEGQRSEEITGGAARERKRPRQWLRLGPEGDDRHQGEPRSNLHHLTPWVLATDSGIRPSRGTTAKQMDTDAPR